MALLNQLALRDFRNIARADLALPAEGIAVVGENGQGKTNLLEAIYYFHVLRSMRGARDQDLIRFDAPAFFIRAQVETPHPHSLSAAFERAGKRKKIVVDGAEPPKLTQALGALPSVVVSPRDVELIIGAPSERRRFLDVMLALTLPRYLSALQAYRAALARRNAALRDIARSAAPRNTATAEVWEPAIAEHGAVLVVERGRWIAQHRDAFAELTVAIGEYAQPEMRYTSTVELPTLPDNYSTPAGIAELQSTVRHALLDSLARKRVIDVKRGATHTGPHRDDIALTLDGRDVRTFGSAGQQRTASIALRLLEARTLHAERKDPPLLLLDDPFAELDPRRADRILGLLHEARAGQTILVVPRASDIPAEFTRLPRYVMEGGVLRANR